MLHNKTTLAIVDDHPIVMEGVAKLLSEEENIDIVGCFTTGKDFIEFLAHTPVNVVLLDITLPDTNGIELCMIVKSMAPSTAILAFSNHDNRNIVMEMMQNGASGYLLKNASLSELKSCIQAAVDGHIAFSQAVKSIITAPQLNDSQRLARLTVREKEILALISAGKTTAEMAELLFVSKYTIESHRKNLSRKFNVKNVAELIRIATLQNFLQ